MAEMHKDVLDEGQKDILETCFDSYQYKLEDVEAKDIRQLKQRKHKLTEMKRNIMKDLEET